MSKYFSRGEKEAFLQCIVALEIIYCCKEEREAFQPHKAEMQDIHDRLKAVLKKIGDDIDADVGRALMNAAKNSTIKISPRNIAGEPELNLVLRDSLNELLSETTMNCMLCDKKRVEANKCRTRKLLIDCMIYGDDTNKNCPYQGIIE